MPTPIHPAGLDGSGAMFDAIAERYDLLNRLMSFGRDRAWRRQTAQQLGGPERALDLATGTGDLAIEVARRNPGAQVIALDPSSGMLDVGRRKTEKLGLTARIEYVQGDAQSLPFPDRTFDAISMAFGIRNVPDRPAALCEMARVARPGAKIALLELTEPSGTGLSVVARLHVHWIVPAMGAIISGSREYAYLSRSIAAFPAPDAFVQIAKNSGLDLVELVRFSFGACHLFVFTPRAEGSS